MLFFFFKSFSIYSFVKANISKEEKKDISLLSTTGVVHLLCDPY